MSLGSGEAAIGELIATAERFAATVRDRRPAGFSEWLDGSERSAVAAVRSFARRLRRGEAAVRGDVAGAEPRPDGRAGSDG